MSPASDDALVAAALLWRVFYSIVPLPFGAITLSRFRKANPKTTGHEAVEATWRPSLTPQRRAADCGDPKFIPMG